MIYSPKGKITELIEDNVVLENKVFEVNLYKSCDKI
jgi:hypothetical protein